MTYEKTANRLRKILKARNLTQQQLSDLTKINKSSISQYINGRNIPASRNAIAMSKVLLVAPEWLMGFGDDDIIPDYVPEIQDFVDVLPKLTDEQRKSLLNMAHLFVQQNV